jgi:hypothetical protein
LGAWVSQQRGAYRRKELSSRARRALERLPGWASDARNVRSKVKWFEAFEYLRAYAKDMGHARVPVNYITEDGFHLGAWASNQRGAYRRKELSRKAAKALEELPGWRWVQRNIRAEMRWFEAFEYLRAYAKDMGHARVPASYVTESGFHLGAWASKQRGAYRRKALSLKARRALEQLPGWAPDLRAYIGETKWLLGLEALNKFAKFKGHSLVPLACVTETGHPLGRWVANQRRAYWRGTLPAKRRRLLERVTKWTWEPSKRHYGNAWSEGLKRLWEYVRTKGHSHVATKYVMPDGYKLGAWVSRQRTLYGQGGLALERVKTLERLRTWVWSVREATWTEHYERVRKYAKCEGNAVVPRRYVEKDGCKLGLWVMSQRQRYHQGRLSRKCREALEQLPGWKWKVGIGQRQRERKRKCWVTNLERLREYAARVGHSKVQVDYLTEDGYTLGRWVRDQRYGYKRGTLSAEQRDALEELPGWTWDAQKSRRRNGWFNNLERLRDYVDREGHANVPQSYVTDGGCKLGRWVSDQRYAYRKGALSAREVKALEELPGWTWAPPRGARSRAARESPPGLTRKWLENLSHLQSYAEREGDSLVPAKHVTRDGYRLGLWVMNQRLAHRRGNLHPERSALLEQVPGWMWGLLRGTRR